MLYLIPRCGVVDLLGTIPYRTDLQRSKLVSRFYGSQWEGPDPGLATLLSPTDCLGATRHLPHTADQLEEKGGLGIAQK